MRRFTEMITISTSLTFTIIMIKADGKFISREFEETKYY